MKKFITTAPRQNVYYKSENGKYVRDENGLPLRIDTPYTPENCAYLVYDHPCCYPIIPVINAYAQDGEEIEVIVLTAAEKTMCEENYQHLCDDLEEVRAEKDLKIKMTRFEISLDETIETHLSTFERLISMFCEDDILYCDITYGSKPYMYMQLLALNYAHQSMNNVYVECVAYGGYDFETKQRKIYDCTKLFLMDQIIGRLSHGSFGNPLEVIKGVLHFNEDEEV